VKKKKRGEEKGKASSEGLNKSRGGGGRGKYFEIKGKRGHVGISILRHSYGEGKRGGEKGCHGSGS